jgi:hypothetical protein
MNKILTPLMLRQIYCADGAHHTLTYCLVHAVERNDIKPFVVPQSGQPLHPYCDMADDETQRYRCYYSRITYTKHYSICSLEASHQNIIHPPRQ